MYVILGLSFGSGLSNPHPTPGLSNFSLALQIVGRMTFSSVEQTAVIVDVPIACALNSMGFYPDRTLSTSSDGIGGALPMRQFFERAAASLREQPLPFPPQGERVRYLLAVQSVCASRALRYAQELISPDVQVISLLPVPCDPTVHPWHARSLFAAMFVEQLASWFDE